MKLQFTWTMPDEQWAKWWSKQREQGQMQFVVRRTMLLAACWAVLYPAFRHFHLPPWYAASAALIGWICVSVAWASVDWKRNEKRFSQLE